MEEKKKENFQSRREFFKNAAKKALPILGAIALMSMPTIKAETLQDAGCTCSTNCQGGCQSCTGYCLGKCDNECSGCTGSCLWGCQGCTSCKGECSGSCSGGCSGR